MHAVQREHACIYLFGIITNCWYSCTTASPPPPPPLPPPPPPSREQAADYSSVTVKIRSMLCHRHHVPLTGYCDEDEMVLVYEYMAHGSLRVSTC